MDAFIVGLLVNLATEGGKSILKEISGNETIVDKIEEAFERALKKWTVNGDIRRKELVRLSARTEQIIQVVLNQSLNKEIDGNIKALLNLFKIELMTCSVANNLLTDSYLNHLVLQSFILQKDIESLKNGQEQMHIAITNSISELSSNLSKRFTPFSEITDKPVSYLLPTDCFIKKINKAKLYIPRSITDVKGLKDIPINRENRQRITLQELINKETHIVLLASAGMGKSIELKETAISIAYSGECYTIFKTLNTYTPEDTIESILPDQWISIPKNKVVLFLDGFDEIEPSALNRAKRRIAQFTEKHKEVKIVISCRTNFYDLSINRGEGTIKGFKEFFLQELSVKDVSDFVSKEYSFKGEDFIQSIFSNKLEDIAFNPFFLQLIIKKYNPDNPKQILKRTDLFKEFIESRFNLDSVHFEETINLRDEKFKALSLLRMTALAMETIGIRVIEEKWLRELICDIEEFKLIKYCTVFMKDEGNGDNWKFEHNYFQEFLCAELLSQQDFKIVKSFISHEKYDKVLPTWFNTVAQLISILDTESTLFNELTSWIIEHDSEVLVNVEKEKLPLSVRKEIFIQIFEHYRNKKIWIDSNKFSDADLAYFGQSSEAIDYILDIAKSSSEDRINRLNALHVLRGFTLGEYFKINAIKESLISIVQENVDDHHFVSLVIRTISDLKFDDLTAEKKVFNIVSHKKSRNIRAAMYAYLLESREFESYIEYYLDGCTLLKKGHPIRGRVTLIDEGWNLNNGLKQFKSPKALIAIISYFIENDYFENSSESEDVYQCIITNCIDAFIPDPEIYKNVFRLMRHHSKHYHSGYFNITVDFFVKTDTRAKAFNEVLDSFTIEEDKYAQYIQLAGLIDEADFEKTINKNLGDDFIDRLYRDINDINIPLAESYKTKVKEISSHEILIPKRIDWNSINEKRVQDSFNLLFDLDAFRAEALRVFGNKEALSEEELWEVRKNNRRVYLEELYIGSALDFIREFNSPVSKKEIEDWFPKQKDIYSNAVIGQLYQYIKNHKTLEIDEHQLAFIKKWYDKYIERVNFKNALTNENDDNFSIDSHACYLTLFMRKFSFDCNKNVLLDMLSFTLGDTIGLETISIEYIIEKVNDKASIDNRIIYNLINHTIDDFSTYKTHIEYALKNNLVVCYKVIIDDLVTRPDAYYQKNNIVDILTDSKVDISLLENISPDLKIDLRLHLFRKLLLLNKKDFVVDQLLKLNTSVYSPDVQNEINKLLVSSGHIEGLKRSVEWIKENKKHTFSQNGQGLSHYSDITVLPLFMELLELSYDQNITSNHEFDKLLRFVVNGMEELALVSEEHFVAIMESMKNFIRKNNGFYKDVEFLNTSIEVIKRKFYETLVVNYDMVSAKTKIKELIK